MRNFENGKNTKNFYRTIVVLLLMFTFVVLTQLEESTFQNKNLTQALLTVQMLIALYVNIFVFVSNSKIRYLFRNTGLNFYILVSVWTTLTILCLIRNLSILISL